MPRIWKALRGWFLAGLLVLIPTAVTFYLFWWAGSWVDSLALLVFKGEFYRKVPGAGLFTVLVLILLVGALTRSWLGSRIVRLHDWFLLNLPMLGRVFRSVRKLAGMIFDEKSRVFREVVLFEYPRRGLWSLGFVAADAACEISAKMSADDAVAVFVATSPNPTSGILVFVKRSEVTSLEMSTEDAFELVMSGGLIKPELGALAPNSSLSLSPAASEP